MQGTRVKTERPRWHLHRFRLRAPVACFVLASVVSWVITEAAAAAEAEREQRTAQATHGRKWLQHQQSPAFQPLGREARAGSPHDLKGSTSIKRQLDADSGLENNATTDALFSGQGEPKVAMVPEGHSGGGGDGGAEQSEAYSIQARNIPFLQPKGQWQFKGGGISMTAKGEPKSGTTWLGRLIPQLALELCGSPTNTWCEMGGLEVKPNEPSPWYEFEMLRKDASETGGSPTLFLHYKGNQKHVIPGMANKNPPDGCTNGGRRHINFFEDDPPCVSGEAPTRERLRGCLWSTDQRCTWFCLGTFRRTAVVFRDPRDVVISEFKMRRDFYHQDVMKGVLLDDFILKRFETLVSWTHQRWVWHTEVLKENSFIAFYDDLKGNHLGMIDLAAFMGLSCSDDQAFQVWQSHQSASPHGDYTTYGLQPETLDLMNATMARLLPPEVSLHWGLPPTDV